jgi:galactose mutarotase-like enzyme
VHRAERRTAGHVSAVVLAGPDLEATIVPGAGMVGASLRHRGDELLVQRGGLDAWRGEGRSFGLPLLHPWANRLRDWRYAAAGRAVELRREEGIVRPDDTGLPIHGTLAAAEDWDVTDCGADADAAWLSGSLDYARRDDRLAAFPFPHALELEYRLTDGHLDVTTTIRATGDVDVPVAFGWHPWLALPGVPRAAWELDLPEREERVLDERNLPTGERIARPAERAPLDDRVLDHHFAVAEDARFALAGGGREISVAWTGGYRFAQVFAPAALDVVCLEPMMTPVAALSTGEELPLIGPGASASASFRIGVRG